MKKMNRTISVMCMAALLAVGFTSCKKDKGSATFFTFSVPEIEGFVADDDKAYVDISVSNTPIKWWDGDQIKVYSVDATNKTPVMADFTAAQGSTGKQTTQFTGDPLDKGSYGYFAFYPASKAVSVQQDNYGTFNVGPTQTYNPALNFAGTSMAGRAFMDPQCVVAASTCDVTAAGSVNTTMKHIFGFANVRIKDSGNTGNYKVKSVTIVDNNLHLTGDITINIPEITTTRLNTLKSLGTSYAAGSIGEDSYWTSLKSTLDEMGYSSNPDQDGYSVTLNCEAADITLNNLNKFFIIPLRPGALLKGFKVTVTFENGSKDFEFNDRQYIIRPGTFSNIQCTL